MEKTKRLVKRLILSLLIILIVLFSGFYIYTLNYYHALPEAIETISNDDIDMEQDKNMIIITPKDVISEKALIFYPGGKVEYLSYIPLMEKVAEEGYTCFLLKVPFNLAVFDQNGANRPIEEYKDIKEWYLSGHSLGGSMASIYASKNKDKIRGLILLGAYPAADLSDSNIKLMSIYGSEDKILNRETFEENKKYDPKDSSYIEIKGGNHAFYGSYGKQKNDGIASISPEEQQELTAEKIIEFMKE